MELKRLGKYTLIQEIGRGGMGAVYHARDEVIGRDVAVKLIAERVLHIPEIRARFYREASSAGRLNHENIVIVHDLGEHEGMPFIVMELLRGSNLRSLLRMENRVTLDHSLSLAIQVCEGLAFAHANGVIHRDVKPENIQVIGDGRVKILDFGIARIASEVQSTAGSGVGTPRYMSPEQIAGGKIDHRTDIFSFGVVLYELLTGINPFSGNSVTEIIHKILHEQPAAIQLENEFVSRDLQRIVSRCLSKNPEHRYPDLHAVAVDLGVVLARQEQSAFSGERLPLLSLPEAVRDESGPTDGTRAGKERMPGRLRVAPPLLRPVRSVSAVVVLTAFWIWLYSGWQRDLQSVPSGVKAGVSSVEPDSQVDARFQRTAPHASAPEAAAPESLPEGSPVATDRALRDTDESVSAPASPGFPLEEAERVRRLAEEARRSVSSIAAQVPPLRAERATLAEAEQVYRRAQSELSKGYFGMAAHSFTEAERRFRKALHALESQLASLRLDAQGARSRALDAQRKAKAFSPDSLQAASLVAAEALMNRAEEQYASTQYQQAVGTFRRAQTHYDDIGPAPVAGASAP